VVRASTFCNRETPATPAESSSTSPAAGSASQPCRVLPHVEADGPANMALDWAILESVAETGGPAVVRTYGWSVPTLSLGYFQAYEAGAAEVAQRGVELVRRPSGGGAILHHHEITYLVVIPRTHVLARQTAALYAAVHGAIAEELRALGLPAGRRGDSACAEKQQGRPFFCFTDCDREDIVLRGVKVVGGAQRRCSGAVLQHGSLLLRRSPLLPDLPGLTELGLEPRDVSFWAFRLREALPRALGLAPGGASPTSGELSRAKHLERLAYRNLAWIRRR
jgi:lipoate-protein ligase A